MANRAASSSVPQEHTDIEELIYEAISGWVSYLDIKKSSQGELRTCCDHLDSLSSDLTHIPAPDTPCQVCQDPDDNVLCLCCKGVFCSRLVNKHNQEHGHETDHCLEFVYRDLSFRCISCNSYLDAQVIEELRPVYIKAYIQKFGEAYTSTFRAVYCPAWLWQNDQRGLKGPLAVARQSKIRSSSSCAAVQSSDDPACSVLGAPASNPGILERIVALEADVSAGKMLLLFNFLGVFLGLLLMVCVMVKI